MLAFDLTTVRRAGDRALQRLTRPELDGFFIHFDADCLSDSIMPAVDYRLPDGFGWEEIGSILAHALESDRAVGLEVTIYNPALDPDRTAARGLTNALAAALLRGPGAR
jgi:arginase